MTAAVADQGALFWFATITLTAGVSLIVAALVLHVKRLLAGGWRGLRWRSTFRRRAEAVPSAADAPLAAEPTAAPSQTIEATATGYQVHTDALPGSKSSDDEPTSLPTATSLNPTLAQLSIRLQRTADRLERMSARVAQGVPLGSTSPLETSGAEVEYVFKASRS